MTLQSLRKAVSVVQQDSFLFTTTIENNIVYGDPWAQDRRIERTAESAQLHNYVIGPPAAVPHRGRRAWRVAVGAASDSGCRSPAA